jgi:outer membrane protein assembly factor BamE (lipoprotein component of BamABCDE complex)
MKKHLLVIAALGTLAGCATAAQHRQAVEDPAGATVTVGTVQKEIHVGMSGADVAAVLGAPNIVSTDEARREVWIYDKVSSTYVYSHSEGGIAGLILGWTNSVAGGISPGYHTGSGASSQTQKTLTVIVKFDSDARVRDFAYHTSTF